MKPFPFLKSRNLIIVYLFVTSTLPLFANIIGSQPYQWQQVAIGGGGAIPGILFHPQIADLIYIRSDNGSMYRWEQSDSSWTDIWQWPSSEQWNLTAVASMAAPSSDTTGNLLYAAAGKYAADWGVPAKGAVYKSTDRGNTWQHTGLDVYIAADWDQRVGERLAIDPHNGERLYYASRQEGLFVSTDGAATWQHNDRAPVGKAGQDATIQNRRGLTFLVFDSRSGADGTCCNTLYLGAWQDGVYRSTDAGDTWDKIPGSPEKPYRAVVDSNGVLYVGHRTGLIKFDGNKWSDITPSGSKNIRFTAIAVDPANPDHLLTAPYEWTHNLPIYRSTDGGNTWKSIKYNIEQDIPWRPKSHWASAIYSLAFDPYHSGHAWYTDWYHPWVTPDISATPTRWSTYEKGRESLTPLCLASPNFGDILLYSGIPEIGGFDHSSLNSFPNQTVAGKGLPGYSTTSIDFAANDPAFAVRALSLGWGEIGEYGLGYTLTGGQEWVPLSSKPFDEATGGRVAVSATGDRVVWMPRSSCMFYTRDMGRNWLETYGAPEDVVTRFNNTDQPLAADRVLNTVFYVYHNGLFYRSDNGAEIWEQVGVVIEGQDQRPIVKAAPLIPHEVWVSLNNDGLWRSSDGGNTFYKIPGITQSLLFDFGMNPPGEPHPAVYVYGKIFDRPGIYRSDDMGSNWYRIDTFPQPSIGSQPSTLAADRQVYGRVFIGTNGKGIFYGELQE